MKPVKLSELIEAVEFDSDEFGNWVDLQNGSVVRLAHSLISAVEGKGAFRYFKDTASRLGLLKQWYEYRDEALEAFVRDWAEAHQVPFIDDTHTNATS